MNKTEVIAISGTSGCGKTTIVKHLAERFNCPSFHFDDYVEENTYPKDMKKWQKKSEDCVTLKYVLLMENQLINVYIFS